MNKKWMSMKNDKRAEMGVGTMIIFIAMVLVAAVAASVLISTSNTVREQAQTTGEQAINNIASGFLGGLLRPCRCALAAGRHTGHRGCYAGGDGFSTERAGAPHCRQVP